MEGRKMNLQELSTFMLIEWVSHCMDMVYTTKDMSKFTHEYHAEWRIALAEAQIELHRRREM